MNKKTIISILLISISLFELSYYSGLKNEYKEEYNKRTKQEDQDLNEEFEVKYDYKEVLDLKDEINEKFFCENRFDDNIKIEKNKNEEKLILIINKQSSLEFLFDFVKYIEYRRIKIRSLDIVKIEDRYDFNIVLEVNINEKI